MRKGEKGGTYDHSAQRGSPRKGDGGTSHGRGAGDGGRGAGEEVRGMKQYSFAPSAAKNAVCKITATVEGQGADIIAHRLSEQFRKENRRRRHRGDSPLDYLILSGNDST